MLAGVARFLSAHRLESPLDRQSGLRARIDEHLLDLLAPPLQPSTPQAKPQDIQGAVGTAGRGAGIAPPRRGSGESLVTGADDRQPRYALYFAPPQQSRWWDLGSRWLGRDAESGATRPRPALDGWSPERLDALTRGPAVYGFHATLKAPFRLADGMTEDTLLRAVAEGARHWPAFTLPPLVPADLDGFIALVLPAPCPPMQALAADCVRRFDPFRAPLSVAERERRRAAGLTPRQETNLARWGYPYVLDDWQFHMTLTSRVGDAAERARLIADLTALFSPLQSEPLAVDHLCVFRQAGRGDPFCLIARVALTG